ncbi:hypothetical protein ADH76_10155 [Enterocloster clostridioformis]|uniref:hypothetical protein n=1 Tax=Enterocloster clostridioformis TaxID=1531 RepID=UPI00080C5AAB|nr:hypothetical protein [Enterocloster clostridioformis]ANU48486.1 hypothetical protein A4V08_24445 [Lachnoclostridium sp. YL32]WAK79595.1 hypothetical protein [Clostridium phage Saumur]NDO29253.1 hypothetical protein [Enterocloster clostridioformis]OXE68812.1 hypothetical protein ADH76_10155 [Enterocloster clostridioformis]QQR02629.1 hypothetical protein I5Q83_10340 [Enterocloster clostridioformis]
MFDIKRLSESDTYKRIREKTKEKAAAALRALPFWVAAAWLGIHLLALIIETVLELAGVIDYMPDYLKIEGFILATVILAIEVITHTVEKKIAKMMINNQNWQSRFKVQMIQNIQFFRATNQLTTREEAKFIRIVNYSARELAKEMQEGKRREEEGMEAEAPEKR